MSCLADGFGQPLFELRTAVVTLVFPHHTCTNPVRSLAFFVLFFLRCLYDGSRFFSVLKKRRVLPRDQTVTVALKLRKDLKDLVCVCSWRN